jgi:hypothetical protein
MTGLRIPADNNGWVHVGEGHLQRGNEHLFVAEPLAQLYDPVPDPQPIAWAPFLRKMAVVWLVGSGLGIALGQLIARV